MVKTAASKQNENERMEPSTRSTIKVGSKIKTIERRFFSEKKGEVRVQEMREISPLCHQRARSTISEIRNQTKLLYCQGNTQAMSFGGFQAGSSQAAEIDESTPWVAAGDGNLALLQESIAKLGLAPNAADSNG